MVGALSFPNPDLDDYEGETADDGSGNRGHARGGHVRREIRRHVRREIRHGIPVGMRSGGGREKYRRRAEGKGRPAAVFGSLLAEAPRELLKRAEGGESEDDPRLPGCGAGYSQRRKRCRIHGVELRWRLAPEKRDQGREGAS